jgi:hypothetical protein
MIFLIVIFMFLTVTVFLDAVGQVKEQMDKPIEIDYRQQFINDTIAFHENNMKAKLSFLGRQIVIAQCKREWQYLLEQIKEDHE